MRRHFVGTTTVLFLFFSADVSAAPRWGSLITPQLITYCNEAGGTAKVFGSTRTDTCDDHLDQSADGGQALTASCDCGEDKCLKDNKCVSNPNRLFHWLFGLKKIEKQTHEL